MTRAAAGLALAVALTAIALAGSEGTAGALAPTTTASTATASHRPLATGPALPTAVAEGWPLESLSAAAAAFREGGPGAARRILGDGSDRGHRALLLGLYAWSAGEPTTAASLLEHGRDPTGLLEDWRLHALAEALAETGAHERSLAELERLLAAHADSPLHAESHRRRLETTYRSGDWLGALRGIEAARQLGLHDDLAPRLDLLEWEIAEARELPDLQRETARHLLVHHPLEASELRAVELFRRPDGEVPWEQFLSDADLVERARQLLRSGVASAALPALEAVPEVRRDLDWFLLEAEALTLERRGADALAALARRPSTPHDRLTQIRQARAAAALEAATVRRGRANADAEQRSRWRDAAWQDLWRIALDAEDSGDRIAALRRLYRLADLEENFELAVDVLRRLRIEDPEEITGYRDLWKLGWRAFREDDLTVAIGIWRELQNLYPEVSTARQALYWSAVAHQGLGDTDRSRRLLAQVVSADTFDFYSRHAARRLGSAPRRGRPLPVSEPWPSSGLLARTALLSELGLDTAAAYELELLRERAEPRAVEALDALILARRGNRRDSVQAAWRAFKRLGKPGQTAVPRSMRELYYPLEYEASISRWAKERGLDPELVFAIVRQESAFDAAAVSRAGARGLMQLMPATGRELAGKLGLSYSTTRLLDPEYSVRLGTRYFAQVLAMFDGDVELALAGYNGGPYRIRRWWREAGPDHGVDRFVEGLALAETTSYVKRIVSLRDSYEALYGAG